MPIIHILSGLPASGKSTFARNLVGASAGRVRRVNLDDIRTMLDTDSDGHRPYNKEMEETALTIQDAAVRAAIDGGFDVVLDNTHLVPRIPKRIKRVVAGDAVFKVHDFNDVRIEECIRRDAERTGVAHVGEDVIRRLASRRASASKSGWRLTDEWMNDRPAVQPYIPNHRLPIAILCDIDGTLAQMDGRSPYDWARVGEDKVNGAVWHTLLAMNGQYRDKIVLLSGRDGSCQAQTVDWLVRNNVPYEELYMREAGDTRPDDIVKAELFDKHIRHRFNVRLVLDDRDSVVTLWRKQLKLPCWQVNYGNF